MLNYISGLTSPTGDSFVFSPEPPDCDYVTFPSLCRKVYIILLSKLNNPSLREHLGLISILPFLFKVLEACAHKQPSQYVNRNQLLSSLQSGFRVGHSSINALLKMTGDMRKDMGDTKVTVLVLIDFSNTFNTVSHEILLAILISHVSFRSCNGS